MAFYVNEDRPTSKAIIHQDNNRCQVPREKQPQDGRWHGPFSTKDEAIRIGLEETNCRQVRECNKCKP